MNAWLIVALLITAMAGCTMTVIEGECTIMRETRTSYQCEPGGKLEHKRAVPPQGEP
jgi:hypothetical protein